VRSNSWEDVSDLAKAYGLFLDPWQETVLQGAMGERSDGQWATPRVGVSVSRQNGKGAIIEARELAGLLLFNEKTIVHSAHNQATARIGFDRIAQYFQNYDDLSKRVRQVGTATNREYIQLKSGAILRFLARSKGSGRGFSADCLIMDEAQILADTAWAAILPTVSAMSNPQIWLFGTPPTPLDNGEVFARFRAGGLERKDSRLCWVEWSCPADVDPDDPAAWAQANPALGIRLQRETILDERNAMDHATFARERLGVWGEASSQRVIGADSWAACADPTSILPATLSIGVDVNPERTRATVAAVGRRADGAFHVELGATREGVAWIVPWIEERVARNDVRAVVVDAYSPAASIIDDLRQRKIAVTAIPVGEVTRAAGSFYDAVHERTLRHVDDPTLNYAVGAGRRRRVGDAWAWSRANTSADITPLVASTFALWGALQSSYSARNSKVKPNRRRGTGRAVVLA
jgi:phage terminase large subunit-like protein